MILSTTRTVTEELELYPWQNEFAESNDLEREHVGTGCGKTLALVAAALRDVDRPRYRALLACNEASMRISCGLLGQLLKWTGNAAQYDNSYRVVRFKSGAIITLTTFAHDPLEIAGERYHFLGIDEAQFCEAPYMGSLRVRVGKYRDDNIPLRIRLTRSPLA